MSYALNQEVQHSYIQGILSYFNQICYLHMDTQSEDYSEYLT